MQRRETVVLILRLPAYVVKRRVGKRARLRTRTQRLLTEGIRL